MKIELADIYAKYPQQIPFLLGAGWVDGEREYYAKQVVFEGPYGEKQVATTMYYCTNIGQVLTEDSGKVTVYRNKVQADRQTGQYILEQIK